MHSNMCDIEMKDPLFMTSVRKTDAKYITIASSPSLLLYLVRPDLPPAQHSWIHRVAVPSPLSTTPAEPMA